jgi:hypothetical protein
MQNVLVERGGGYGHAENFAPVRVCGEGVARVRITGVEDGNLIGEAA